MTTNDPQQPAIAIAQAALGPATKGRYGRVVETCLSAGHQLTAALADCA